jgi:hypothetical protein
MAHGYARLRRGATRAPHPLPGLPHRPGLPRGANLGSLAPHASPAIALRQDKGDTSMTHTQTGMGQALGVGALISSTFSIYFRRFPAIFLFGFAVYAVIGAISALVLGAGLGTTGVVPLVLDAALNLVAGSLLTSVIVLLAYDAKLGRPLRMSGYVGAALQVILVVLLLSLITSVIIFGAVAIIVGPAVALQSGFLSFVAAVGAVFVGLWLAALFSATIPAAVIERAGFGALGRSIALTQGYRWPIVGLFLIMYLIAILVAIVLVAIIAGLLLPDSTALSAGLTAGTSILGVLIEAAAGSIAYSIPAIMTALIYARLREIKDGIGVESLASIFR